MKDAGDRNEINPFGRPLPRYEVFVPWQRIPGLPIILVALFCDFLFGGFIWAVAQGDGPSGDPEILKPLTLTK